MAENINDAEVDNEVKQLPDAVVLNKIKREHNRLKGEMDERRGELGSVIKNAENDHGINRKAFKLCMSLMKMDETKLESFLAHFDHYRDQFKLDAQLSLLDGTEISQNNNAEAA